MKSKERRKYLFRMRPIGVVSKNAIGACKTLTIMPSNKWRPAFHPMMAEYRSLHDIVVIIASITDHGGIP